MDTIKGASGVAIITAESYSATDDSGFGSYAVFQLLGLGWGCRGSMPIDNLPADIKSALERGTDVEVEYTADLTATPRSGGTAVLKARVQSIARKGAATKAA